MVEYNPFWDDVIDDPWPVYEQLRNEAPAYYVEELGAWAISRFADITKVSMDRGHFTVSRGNTLTSLATPHNEGDPLTNDAKMFMMKDPPTHTQYRAALSPYFTPRRLAATEPLVREIVDEHITPLLAQGRFDASADLARKVAAHLACKVLGIPVEAAEELGEYVGRMQPFIHGRPPSTADEIADLMAASASLNERILDFVNERRASGKQGDDLMEAFSSAEIDGKTVPSEDVAVHLSGLVIGGFETMPKHFGTLIYLLHQHPDQRAKVAANPELHAYAVEEALRYDAPTHVLGRRVIDDIEFHGEKLLPGQGVLLLYASGNRDERQFERADEFDVERKPSRTLTFGAGIHLCMGLHVARLESRVMLERILEHSPEYEVELEGVERCRLGGIHGYDAVPIVLS